MANYSYIMARVPHTHIKFCGFCFFDWQENSWGIYFCCHGSVVGTIIVQFAKYASYCGLIFMDKRHTMKFTKIIHSKISMHIVMITTNS